MVGHKRVRFASFFSAIINEYSKKEKWCMIQDISQHVKVPGFLKKMSFADRTN